MFHKQTTQADGKYCITGANDRTVRLWNPTRIDPAYTTTASLHRTSFVTNSSQEYYGGGHGQHHRSPTANDDDISNEEDRLRSPPSRLLPSALPIQTYTDGHVHPIYAVTTDRLSTVLLSASDRTLLATDLVTAQSKRRWWGHNARIEYVACLGGNISGSDDATDNGLHLGGGLGEDIYASASYDSTVRLWDGRSRSNEPLMILTDAKDAVTCIVSAPRGEAQILTSSVDGRMRTYDLRTARLITDDTGPRRVPITSFSLSSTSSSNRLGGNGDYPGSLVAASCLDGIIRIWNRVGSSSNDGILCNRKMKRIVHKLHSYHTSDKYKVGCAFTSDNKYIISGSECGGVAVYSVDTNCYNYSKNNTGFDESVRGRSLQRQYYGGTATTLCRHVGPTCSVATCPMISRPWLVLSASYDGTAIVWTSREQYDSCLDG